MRLSKIVLAGTLSAMLFCSFGAYAATISENDFCRNESYDHRIEGTFGEFCAAGTSYAYTTMYNETSNIEYMEAKVREYTYGVGFTDTSSEVGYVDPGRTADSGNISRDPSNSETDFYHYAYVYTAPTTSSSTKESISFVALQ